jgi:hypothetical protein
MMGLIRTVNITNAHIETIHEWEELQMQEYNVDYFTERIGSSSDTIF